MKLKFLKSLSCFVFSTTSLYSFALEEKKVEEYLDKMLSYQVDFKNQENKLSGIIGEINNELVNDGNDPYLWYLKGRSSWAALYVYKGDQKERFKNLIPVEYQKALELNSKLEVLTESQLHHIHGSHAVLVEASRQYIGLKNKKRTLEKKEHLRLLREKVIPGLIKQNKLEEALVEMNYIDANFTEYANGSTGNTAWRKYFEQEIESQKIKKKKVEQQEKAVQSSGSEGAEKAEDNGEQ